MISSTVYTLQLPISPGKECTNVATCWKTFFKTALNKGKTRLYYLGLDRILKAKGVRLIRQKVDSLHDLTTSYDLMVNCSGHGAAQLVGDRSVVPTSGHVLRVRAPWINSAMGVFDKDRFAYIIPK